MIKKILKDIGILLLALAVVSISLIIYLGITHHQSLVLPTPTGAYSVGRTEYDWVDNHRIDPLSDTPAQKRELLIWVWYPAKASQRSSLAPYLPPAWVKAREMD